MKTLEINILINTDSLIVFNAKTPINELECTYEFNGEKCKERMLEYLSFYIKNFNCKFKFNGNVGDIPNLIEEYLPSVSEREFIDSLNQLALSIKSVLNNIELISRK